MRQWKIALSFAVVGALASPAITSSYKLRPTTDEWVQLTPSQKANIATYMEETKNCQTLVDRAAKLQTPDLLSSNAHLREYICRTDLEKLIQGGEFRSHPSALKYLAANLGVALAGFLFVFGLAFFIPALARRYWRWLRA